MLSRIDDIIYPNRCEVIELSSQRFIYPIFKNGSSSLTEHAKQNNHRTLFNQQIYRCDQIHVILREPLERFLSGINTYVYNLLRDNPKLDPKTILYFVENYLFLNRHYAPQISWLVHLNKFTNPACKLILHGMDELKEFTPLAIKPVEQRILSEQELVQLTNNEHNSLYLNIDKYLVDLIGTELTFTEILDLIKSKDSVAYNKICTAPD